jgi:cytochrome c-type biogenesis protein CcmH/NrfF
MRVLILALLTLSLAPGAAAAESSATLVDLEDEVMCPICGTLLELSEAPQAQRERAFIAGLIAKGETKAEIKDALVAEYGREVLALPEGSGFSLSAYLVPAIAFALAALALGLGVSRWRRASGGQEPAAAADRPEGEDAEQLEADLARYDL